MSIDRINQAAIGNVSAHGTAGKMAKKKDVTPKDSFNRVENVQYADEKTQAALRAAAQKKDKQVSKEIAQRKLTTTDIFKGALDVREKLETLKGEDRQKWIQEYRKENAGKIFVSIDMHDHQPIYRPGTHPADTPEVQNYVLGTGDAENRREVYRDGEAYAIEEMKNNPDYPHFGFQVSFSGSLMENMQKTADRGLWPGKQWNQRYKNLRESTSTSEGAPRLDFVNIGYHHPLMGLIASGHQDGGVNHDKDIELQFKMHQQAVKKLFGGPVSKGLFPPEMAFSERMIPAVKKVGIDWTMVDNIHFDRANQGYNNPRDGLKPPNKADQRNPAPESYENLPNDLAKSHVVSPDALRPHYIKHTDPITGNEELMIAVPEERSLSSYIQKDRSAEKMQIIIDKFQAHNTDPNHPIFVLYATDGDNNGSNSGEFHRNVPIDLATRFPGQVVFTTVQDYLELFPPDKPTLVKNENNVKRYEGGDVIHVEDGSWWGANLGDPEFSKWVDDPAYTGYSPKNNSWATLTAAKNEVLTADSLEPAGNTEQSVQNIIDGTGSDTEKAWHGLLVGQTSCYEYWNPDNVLSYSSVKGANMAVDSAEKVIQKYPKDADKVGPSIFLPRHYPYNPKGFPANFNVVSYVHDVHDVKSVKVKYRADADGVLNRPEDFMYQGGGVKKWDGEVFMNKLPFPELPNKPDVWIDPRKRAGEYRANVELNIPEDKPGEMIQYYVEAEDSLGNVSRSPIRNVWVSNIAGDPGEVSNDELHNQLKSGDAGVMGNAIAFCLSTGRNDVHIFNHVFFRMENADEGLMSIMDTLSEKGRVNVSGEAGFRDEYITRLDKHTAVPENVEKLKAHPKFKHALIDPLKDQAADPRVQRIMAALG